jgi:hypothetical protein
MTRHALLCLAYLTALALFPTHAYAQSLSWSPVGRQYASWGVEGSAWFGAGTVTDLDGAHVGDFSTRAWGLGPLKLGISHVVAGSTMFELRLGAGALAFEDDRLLSQDLDAQGDPHVGALIEGEFLGRWMAQWGGTASLGVNLARVRLPGAWGGLLRASPRLGWMWWEPGFAGYNLLELGYQYPVVNGLTPNIPDAGTRSPVTSQWHVVTLSWTQGF